MQFLCCEKLYIGFCLYFHLQPNEDEDRVGPERGNYDRRIYDIHFYTTLVNEK